MGQVNAARANLQTILDNLTAGVIVLDAAGPHPVQSNPGATRILRVPLAAYQGKPLAKCRAWRCSRRVQQRFDDYLSERAQHGLDHWQQSFELNAATRRAQANAITLVARGAEMPGRGAAAGVRRHLRIVSAQRAQAWGEVARRLAHEIKNPLTPIQLSAERMEMKLAGKLGEARPGAAAKSVQTIVDQVDAMKRLVNEFRDYARLPAAELKPVDLNALVATTCCSSTCEGDATRGGRRCRCAGARPARPKAPLILGDASSCAR
jgi:nitrogen fixation/metabolism regulation signal transduction histidine kinase